MESDGRIIPYVDGRPTQVRLARRARGRTIAPLEDTYFGSLGLEIIDTLEQSKLTLANHAMQDMGITREKPMYGNFMTQFGRAVTSLVHSPQDTLHRTFEQPVELACNRLMDLPEHEDPIINTHFDVLRQVGRRAFSRRREYSDIPVHYGRPEDQYLASCHLAESRYVDALAKGQVSVCNESGIPFLQKTLGDVSQINLDALIYKGITLPPGWIFSRSIKAPRFQEPHLVPVRPSLFAFDTADTTLVYPDIYSKLDTEGFVQFKQELSELQAQPRAEYSTV